MLNRNFTFQKIWDLATISRFDQSKIDIPVFNNPVLDSAYVAEKKIDNVIAIKLKRSIRKLELPILDFLENKVINLDDADEFISIFLDCLARPQRYEPENVYKLHTFVPTVRTIFPYKFLLALSYDKKTSVYEYHPSYHSLELIEIRESESEKNGDISIICRALYWKLAQRYGEYAPYLVHLEAGAIKAMAIQLLGLFGLKEIFDNNCLFDADAAIGCGLNFERDVFNLSTNSEFNWSGIHNLETWQIKKYSIAEVNDIALRFPQLNLIIDHFHSPIGSDTKNEEKIIYQSFEPMLSDLDYGSVKEAKFPDYFDALHYRSAANDSSGVTSLILNPDISVIKNVCCLAKNIENRTIPVEGHELIRLNYLAIQSSNNSESGLFDNSFVKKSNEFQVFDLLDDALPNKSIKINFSSMVGIFLLAVDLDAAEKMYPSCAARIIYQAAGAKMFNLSVAASAFGFYVRPMRMLLENILEDKLSIEGKIIFQIVLGYKRRTNFSFRL